MIACHRDPYQPQFPAISDVRYTGPRGACGDVEVVADVCATAWFKDGARSVFRDFNACDYDAEPDATRLVLYATRHVAGGEQYYSIVLRGGKLTIGFDAGS